ncbi:hypothetical protein JOF41_006841 [Saccharothrix coeruleofusca]|uniref:hypothetical protein n=1 Tax=Saccharothrix coeruleofusca TaxID=33919 RepID=UPI001AEA8276|nr:hypothetical protein [Saccharothrix coeruleofusca]MBP2340663.1 hypothetical protein [Saccharothrix coeruleofusca]
MPDADHLLRQAVRFDLVLAAASGCELLEVSPDETLVGLGGRGATSRRADADPVTALWQALGWKPSRRTRPSSTWARTPCR